MANKQLITKMMEQKLNGDVIGNILSFVDNLFTVDIGKDDFKNPFHIEIKRTFGINRTEFLLTSFFTNCYMCENNFDWKRSSSKKYAYQYCPRCYKKWADKLSKTGRGGGRRPEHFVKQFERGVCLIKL